MPSERPGSRLVALGIGLAALATPFGALAQDHAAPPDVRPNPLIVDTDMGREDWLALLLIFGHPNAEVRAISVVGDGVGRCPAAASTALGIVALARGGDEIPVACDSTFPLDGFHALPPAWRDAADAADFGALPKSGRAADPRAAVDLIIATLRASDRPLTIVTIGPLTNIALAFENAPDMLVKVREVVMMAGAVEAPGNVAQPGVSDFPQESRAEWNAFLDPIALDIVLRSGVPIRLVPLDATRHVPVGEALSQAIFAGLETPAARWAAEVNQSTLQSGGFYFWDALTASIALDRSVCESATDRRLSVDAATAADGWSYPGTAADFPSDNWQGQPRRHLATATAGAFDVDPQHGAEVRVCEAPDVAAFVGGFRRSLAAESNP